MTQSIFIQVGQCGNQIGCRFWDLALKEHASNNTNGYYDEALGGFFRNVDSRSDDPIDIPVGNGRGKIRSLKARAVLVDMEEGVVNELLQGPLGSVFDHKQLITDVSGSGNNWAVGYNMYGNQYKESVLETMRRAAEMCDCLQCFFIMHSMGGGTGSGVGTSILSLLADEYPHIYRFSTAVYPSADDDVITSPYNSVLAMNQLTEHSDCVLPIENQALLDIVNKVSQACQTSNTRASSRISESIDPSSTLTTNQNRTRRSEKPFDSMNNIVANLLLGLTSSARFEGSLNIDLNEITMNLVPFPRLHYLVSSLSPLYTHKDMHIPVRRLDQMFSDAFSRDHQLIKADPRNSLYLACALMLRGQVEVSDIRRNIERLRPSLKFIHWNKEGWKTGLCSVAPTGQPYSLLTMANNTCVHNTFTNLGQRFMKLYKRKAHLHHYTSVDGMDISMFEESANSLDNLILEYKRLEKEMGIPHEDMPRLQIN